MKGYLDPVNFLLNLLNCIRLIRIYHDTQSKAFSKPNLQRRARDLASVLYNGRLTLRLIYKRSTLWLIYSFQINITLSLVNAIWQSITSTSILLRSLVNKTLEMIFIIIPFTMLMGLNSLIETLSNVFSIGVDTSISGQSRVALKFQFASNICLPAWTTGLPPNVSPLGYQTVHSLTHYGMAAIARSIPACSNRACSKSGHH